MRITPDIMLIAPNTGPLFCIAALTHEDMLASSLTLPLEILTGAAQALGRADRQRLNIGCFSQAGGPITIQSGLTLETTPLSELTQPDLLIVPAIWRQPQRVLRRQPEQMAVIDQYVSAGGLTISVGSGSFLLAETGRMTGRTMTTHWQWFDTFAHRYPRVKLERRQLITQSENVFCVSSVNSVADLMVYLCGELFSPRVARYIENQFSPEIRQRFSPSPVGAPKDLHHDELIADVQTELNRDLRAAPAMTALAAQLGVSPRTLIRRFKSATGVSIGQYLQQRRLDEAQALLRRTNLSITEVGVAVGLNDASHFSRMFREQTGVTPSAFRTAVRDKSFAAKASTL
ncbi:MAG: helix-turn-helix domain-containing protein [Halieaceae bacterium]|nr:MAG: helix-turn-helix domain-containing protein [Halieaceae bacterium]